MDASKLVAGSALYFIEVDWRSPLGWMDSGFDPVMSWETALSLARSSNFAGNPQTRIRKVVIESVELIEKEKS